MKSFFFGNSTRQLFGSYRPPGGAPRDAGILLCYPGAQELNMTHWAFRKLAGLLTREGFPVLRFDYSCTGDSAGAIRDGHPDAWREDIVTAIQELKDLAGVRAVSAVGMRLGAALATDACARGLALRDLVLWEPIVTGARYLGELEALDRKETQRLLHPPPDPQREELAGFASSKAMRSGLEAIDLRASMPSAATRVSLFVGEPQPAVSELREVWSRGGVQVSLDVVRDDASVTAGGAREAAALYTNVLAAITERLAGGAR